MLGEQRLLDPITRAHELLPASRSRARRIRAGRCSTRWISSPPRPARYEPLSLATHTTASNIDHLITFYELTGDTRYLARVPEALDWLDKVKLAKPDASGRTHPTFIELGTNRALYVHRRGSNVVNGEYFVDYDPAQGHRPLSTDAQASTCAGMRKAL